MGDNMKVEQGNTKRRWSSLPIGTLNCVIDAMRQGDDKYGAGNWSTSDPKEARTVYYDAAMRHIDAWWQGETWDRESGKPHLAHAVANLLILMWYDIKGEQHESVGRG